MRLRLLRRRLTISSPRMAIRSAMPWPLRWVLLAVVFGFCAAIALWAFEFGKDIAGLEKTTKEELLQLRTQNTALRQELEVVKSERDKAQSIANTAGTLMTAEKTSQERLVQQVKQLEADNRALRDDLGFFEKLIPAATNQTLAIRGLQVEAQEPGVLKWQVLVIQSNKNAAEFSGRIEISFVGIQGGKPWSAALPSGAQSIKIRQYGRLEGALEVPASVVVKSVTAKVLDGSVVRASQTIKL